MAIQLRTVAGIAIAGVAIGFAGLSAEAAGADTTAEAFLAQINGQGITYSSPRQARDRAEVVCSKLADGVSARNVAGKIYAESGLTEVQAAYFVAASVTFYCAGSSSRILQGDYQTLMQ
jgi:hypothetical protein